MGYPLNLSNPRTFNEKLQWLKLYDRNLEYIKKVDKYAVKNYVIEKIGEQYLIPTLGVWDTFEQISFDELPNQFVLKCTHDSGGIVICRDKSDFDIEAAKYRLSKSLKINYFWGNREWPYKNVKPRIIAEKYMEDSTGNDLIDYKVMCFNGEPKCTFVCENRSSKEKFTITVYDTDWNIMPFEREHPRRKQPGKRPSTYEEMMRLSKKLSENIPFVRVDFYEIQGKLYFGEMTFYPGAGFTPFKPYEWDIKLGEWLILPDIKNAK
uniref:ATP-grasp fold amidoligase family protein n=1 Tax=Acetatifactor sp. TaxID=1872090 RepID=UPI0040562FD9